MLVVGSSEAVVVEVEGEKEAASSFKFEFWLPLKKLSAICPLSGVKLPDTCVRYDSAPHPLINCWIEPPSSVCEHRQVSLGILTSIQMTLRRERERMDPNAMRCVLRKECIRVQKNGIDRAVLCRYSE